MDSDPLIPAPIAGAAVDFRRHPATRTTTGGWTSALFIIGVELAERSAFYSISMNLITYLTDHLGEPTAAAAAGVNTWSGVSMMLPLVGAFVSDSYLGRYRTILGATLLYILGLGLLTLSTILPSFGRGYEVALFYFTLYLVGFAQGGHKPCVQAFGADQFDENDPQERVSRGSFFNWWYFGMSSGIMVSIGCLTYVQDNISWGLGFGIPCILLVIALVVFLMGTKTYRYYILEDQSPFARIGRTFAILIRSGGVHAQNSSHELGEGEFALTNGRNHNGGEISIRQVEEAKGMLQLFPLWSACLLCATVGSQIMTFFIKQGSTMDRRIGSSFQVPPAALQIFLWLATIIFIPIYDRILVPITRKLSKTPSGFTPLQRIGIGIFISLLSLVVSALVEIKRLNTAREFGLIDRPDITIPLSLWWLVPQYILIGISDVFSLIGLQEFFYDQVPDALRSLGLALYLSILGIGSFISSFLVVVIDQVTKKGGESWFSDNLNRAHLDYFYWLLAALTSVGFVIFVFFARSYVYKNKHNGVLF